MSKLFFVVSCLVYVGGIKFVVNERKRERKKGSELNHIKKKM